MVVAGELVVMVMCLWVLGKLMHGVAYDVMVTVGTL